MIGLNFTQGELELLQEYWEKIGELDGSYYGCKAIEYSPVRIIKRAIEDGEFQAFILVGGKGHGKSTYSIKTVAYYFMIHEDMECGEAYQEALSRIAFTAWDLLQKIEDYGDIIIWDDAGLHGSTYYWFIEGAQEYLVALSNWYDVSRTDINALIMSTPTKKKLPPIIRSDPETILVRVRKAGRIQRNGRWIKRSEAVGVRNVESLYRDQVYREELFRDKFMVFLPDPVYNYYNIIRRKYSQIAREALRKSLEKLHDSIPLPLED